MRRLLILADDFTGACDAAAPFASSRGTLVVHGLPAAWPSNAEAIDVLSVDLDLRERSSAHAEVVAREAAQQLCSARPSADVLLKIDSTLRGPIAGLVAGALQGSGRAVAVLAPAFPEQGRLFRDGRVYVDGLAGGSLTEALGMEHTALLGANFARSAEAVELAVEHARTRGARHVVVDADGPASLQSLATAWRRHAAEWLLVGSAGLARQIARGPASHARQIAGGAPASHARQTAGSAPASHARQIAGSASARRNEGLLSATARGPVLIVAGSPTPQTQAQIERLRGLGPIVVIGAQTPVPPRPSGAHEVIVV